MKSTYMSQMENLQNESKLYVRDNFRYDINENSNFSLGENERDFNTWKRSKETQTNKIERNKFLINKKENLEKEIKKSLKKRQERNIKNNIKRR